MSVYSRAKLCDNVDRNLGSRSDDIEAGTTSSPAFNQIVSILNAPRKDETSDFDFETLCRELCAAPSASFAIAIAEVCTDMLV